MKNIWKLLMVAMIAIAMVGCQQNNTPEEPEEPDNRKVITYPSAATVATNGIYETKIYADGLSTADWGANEAGPTIKVIFVKKDVAQKIIDGEIGTDGELFTNENDCYVYCNNDIDNGHFEMLANNADKDYSDVVGFQKKYDGVLVSKADADGNYKAIVDISKIKKDQLLKKGADETTDGVASVDLSQRIPLFLGSVTFNQAKSKGVVAPLSFWNAAILFGEPSTTTWPADAKIKTHNALENRTFKDINTIVGTVATWDNTIKLDANGKYEFTATDATARFKFTVGDWSFQAGSADADTTNKPDDPAHEYTALGTANLKASNNATALIYTVEVGKTYVITYTVAEDGKTATSKIEEKQ